MRASGQACAQEASAVFPRRRLRHRLRRERGVLAAVSVGGGCGALARYLIDLAIPVRPGAMPWATLMINVVGCLVLGALNVYLLEVWPPRRYVRPLCAIGFLGGFTTFSTYTAEIRDLMGRGAVPLAAGYALGSLAAGVAALWAGVAAARLASRHRLRRLRRLRRVGPGGRVNGR